MITGYGRIKEYRRIEGYVGGCSYSSGSFSSVICGIDWVTGKSGTIEVANLNLGATVTGTDDGSCGWTGNSAAAAMHRAICGSVDAGVFYAVAAGNDSKDSLNDVPAAFDQVLTVMAMADFDGEPGNNGISGCRPDQDDTFADFSNYTTTTGSDDDHTIAAPGVCIRSTWPGNRRNKGGTYMISGTSMASPHVAGTAALCIASENCSGLSPNQMIAKLRRDAEAKSNRQQLLTTVLRATRTRRPASTTATWSTRGAIRKGSQSQSSRREPGCRDPGSLLLGEVRTLADFAFPDRREALEILVRHPSLIFFLLLFVLLLFLDLLLLFLHVLLLFLHVLLLLLQVFLYFLYVLLFFLHVLLLFLRFVAPATAQDQP